MLPHIPNVHTASLSQKRQLFLLSLQLPIPNLIWPHELLLSSYVLPSRKPWLNRHLHRPRLADSTAYTPNFSSTGSKTLGIHFRTGYILSYGLPETKKEHSLLRVFEEAQFLKPLKTLAVLINTITTQQFEDTD